jgi:hypothetical protein
MRRCEVGRAKSYYKLRGEKLDRGRTVLLRRIDNLN